MKVKIEFDVINVLYGLQVGVLLLTGIIGFCYFQKEMWLFIGVGIMFVIWVGFIIDGVYQITQRVEE